MIQMMADLVQKQQQQHTTPIMVTKLPTTQPMREVDVLRAQLGTLQATVATKPPTPQPMSELESSVGDTPSDHRWQADGPAVPGARSTATNGSDPDLRVASHDQQMQCNQPATYPTGADASTQENEMFGINVNKFNDILRTMLPPGTMDEL